MLQNNVNERLKFTNMSEVKKECVKKKCCDLSN